MEALDVVMAVLHKNVLNEIVVAVRRGPKGYGLLLKLRLLLYAMLVGIFSTRKLVKHLRKRPYVWKTLGFKKIPNRRCIDRWKKAVAYELQQVVLMVGNKYLKISKSKWTILDSTPIIDIDDPEATIGYNSQGRFKGFKLHMSCDEHEVPLRAAFTQAHVHDSQKGKELLAPTPKAGGDSAYESQELKKEAKQQGTKLITSHNPRREGKEKRKPTPKALKKVRVCIEQCNSLAKNQVMNYAWKIAQGLKAKAVFAFTAVLAIQAIALYSIKHIGYPLIRIQEMRI